MARTKTKGGRPAANGTRISAQNIPKKTTKSKKATTANGNGHSNESKLQDVFTPDQLRQLAGFFDNRELLRILTEVKNGNFSVRMPIDQVGLSGKICDTLNEIISMNEKMMTEFTRAGNTIGKQGKLTQRIELPNAKGAWTT